MNVAESTVLLPEDRLPEQTTQAEVAAKNAGMLALLMSADSRRDELRPGVVGYTGVSLHAEGPIPQVSEPDDAFSVGGYQRLRYEGNVLVVPRLGVLGAWNVLNAKAATKGELPLESLYANGSTPPLQRLAQILKHRKTGGTEYGMLVGYDPLVTTCIHVGSQSSYDMHISTEPVLRQK